MFCQFFVLSRKDVREGNDCVFRSESIDLKRTFFLSLPSKPRAHLFLNVHPETILSTDVEGSREVVHLNEGEAWRGIIWECSVDTFWCGAMDR